MAADFDALSDLARDAGSSFDGSPTGRWVCIKSGDSPCSIYVVQLPWSEGYAVLGGSDVELAPRRYRSAREAVLAAVRFAGEASESERCG